MDVTCIHGPKGLYSIELQDGGQWSVKLYPEDVPALKVSKFVLDEAGNIGWQTRDEAVKVAYIHAGINQHCIFPPPDRRGLVAHSRNLS